MMQFEKTIETMKEITERYEGDCYDSEHNEHFQGLFEKLSKQLNKMYPPNPTDFIKGLDWVKNKNQYISRSEIHFAVVYKCSESDDYIATFQLGNKEFKTKDGFKSPEDSKAWANEQYKEKLKEVLGL